MYLGVVMSEREEVLKNVADNFGSDVYSLELDVERVGITKDQCHALEHSLRVNFEAFVTRLWEIAEKGLTPATDPQ